MIRTFIIESGQKPAEEQLEEGKAVCGDTISFECGDYSYVALFENLWEKLDHAGEISPPICLELYHQ